MCHIKTIFCRLFVKSTPITAKERLETGFFGS